MSGTKAGGKKAAVTNKARHGDGFYAAIGSKGGKLSPRVEGFEKNKERAKTAGAKGGGRKWIVTEAEGLKLLAKKMG